MIFNVSDNLLRLYVSLITEALNKNNLRGTVISMSSAKMHYLLASVWFLFLHPKKQSGMIKLNNVSKTE